MLIDMIVSFISHDGNVIYLTRRDVQTFTGLGRFDGS